MNNQYLMPANSKKSRLIFGFFTTIDLILCLIGSGITIIMLAILNSPSTLELILSILPLLIAATLVVPVPNYHNVLQLLMNMINYYLVGRKKYYWKGWCVKDEANK